MYIRLRALCIVNININTDTAYKHILVNYDNMLMIHVSSANVYIVANNQICIFCLFATIYSTSS